MLVKIKAIAIITALVLVCTLLLEAIYWVHVTSPKIYETVCNTHDTSTSIKDYIDFQIEIVKSPAYQKNFEHASELGDIGAKTVAQFARRTLPRADKALDEMTARLRDLGLTEAELTATIGKLGTLVVNTDNSFNSKDGLLPAVTKIVNKSQASLDELNAAMSAAADSLNITTDELKRRLADPRVDSMMDEALGILKEGRGTMEQVHKASEQAPLIASDLEKIAKESSRFARITLIANILGVLGRAFLP